MTPDPLPRRSPAALAAGLVTVAAMVVSAPGASPLAVSAETGGLAITDAATSTPISIDVPDAPTTPALAMPALGEITSTTGAPAPTAAAAALQEAPAPDPGAPPPVAPRGAGVPVGKGMWIWLPDRADGGDPAAIVARATSVGLTHLYVRTGSSRQGFEATAFLEALLPVAHDAGLRVYGWDFPYLEDIAGDIQRALTAVNYRTAGGHRIDGFVPDIETGAEGTNLTAESAGAYSQQLRAAVGEDYPLVACVPHPSPQRQVTFPYDAIVPYFDAVAPMSYWLNRQPEADAQLAVSWLRSRFDKPVIPIGQAYDGAPEGGRPGPPPADEINRFIRAAEAAGATGVSFWSWQHATQEIWDAIAAAPELTVPVEDTPLDREQVVAVQTQLSSMGYWAPRTGAWDQQSVHATRVFQIEVGLVPTGVLDAVTRARLLGPLAPPVGR